MRRKISPSSPNFPLWFELGNKLKQRLYPSGNESSDALRLASEYRATFGQQALDDLLLEAVPDDAYIPGMLHKVLLTLPWSDVFTTNYDTLLERTRASVYGRKYDVIHTCADLPRGQKPRIIKLHGSFPSYRPFIFTEEDYRTYPRRFAPFVNTVQQSMMENTFCLLGFSGDDLNFLNWLGWIRDNLGESVPPIYLCGVLDLSNTARQLYTQRQIIPIDLAPLFPKSEYSDGNERHSLATEWFLHRLLMAETLDKTCWPKPPSPNRHKNFKWSERLPPIISVQTSQRLFVDLQPFPWEISSKKAAEIWQGWKSARCSYPGWIVAPYEKRRYLWTWTKYWIDPIMQSINNFDPVLALLLLYELNWRLECTLTPLFQNWEEVISNALMQVNPFQLKDSALETAMTHDDLSNKLKEKEIPLNEFQNSWINIAFAIMRTAREDSSEQRFNEWRDRLQPIASSNAIWRARWFYEQALWHLFHFDIDAVYKLLAQWPTEERLTLWELRRAAILAETGDIKTAKQISERSLNLIRDGLQRTPSDYNLLSQESWFIYLLQIIIQSDWRNNDSEEGQAEEQLYKSRLQELSLYLCRPESEIEQFSTVLQKESPRSQSSKQITRGFDPHDLRISHEVSSYDTWLDDIRPAFELMRMTEEAGIPARCGYVVIGQLSDAARWTCFSAPFWSMSLLMRSQYKKPLEKWYGRTFVATIPEIQIEGIGLNLINALEQVIQESVKYQASQSIRSQINFFSEFLSRLCFRFNESLLERSLNIVFRIIKKSATSSLYFKDDLKPLLRRVLPHLSVPLIIKYLSSLLMLGLPIEYIEEAENSVLTELTFDFFKDIPLNGVSAHDFEASIQWEMGIRSLIDMVEHHGQQVRSESAFRLACLFRANLLDSDAVQRFGRALWSRCDVATRLPAETSFIHSSFMVLPGATENNAAELVRNYVLQSEIPPLIIAVDNGMGSLGYTASRHTSKYVRTILNISMDFLDPPETSPNRVNWSIEDLHILSRKIIDFWDENFALLRQYESLDFMGDTIKEFIRIDLISFLGQVILPNLNPESSIWKEHFNQITEGIEALDISTLSLLPPALAIFPERAQDVELRVKAGLRSLITKEIKAALYASYYWMVQSHFGKYQAPQSDLLYFLINFLIAAKQPILDTVLILITRLADRIPELFNQQQIEQLLTSLEYLIRDTQLPQPSDLGQMQEEYSRIALDDRPDSRSASARLAYTLYRWYERMLPEEPKPEILLHWQEVCQTDVLPEVRKAWGAPV
jgi:hypothetical protein